jgi:hypothetical protein
VKVRVYHGPALASTGVAQSAVYDRQDGNGGAKSVAFHFFPSKQSRERGGRASQGIDVTAKEVAGNLHTQVADASGGVTVQTGIGDRASTPTAHYDGSVRQVSGHDGVAIQGVNYHLSAPAFRLSLTEERLELSGGVQGQAEGRR